VALPTTAASEVDINTAQSLASFADCTGRDCTTCNVVNIANGLIKWLIGFLFVLFAVLIAWAGFGLVTSGGNPGALDAAKDKFSNAIIGIILVLSAWLIVDTLMRALVGNDQNPGSVATGVTAGGTVSGWLFWSQVQCYVPVVPDADALPFDIGTFDPYVSPVWVGDPSSGFGSGEVVSTTACTPTPNGNRDCQTQIAACRTSGGIPQVNTENPDNHTVNCVKTTPTSGAAAVGTGSGSSGCAGGTCVPLTIPCKTQRSCSIAPDMVSRLARMHAAAGVSGARVTEAMPATREHKSVCHTNGTCIDYGKAGGMSGAEVLRVVNAASANGLRAIYEVKTASQRDSLIAAGVPSGNIKVLGDWISAPHFSIYGN
jgi:Type IV secretion system pilin